MSMNEYDCEAMVTTWRDLASQHYGDRAIRLTRLADQMQAMLATGEPLFPVIKPPLAVNEAEAALIKAAKRRRRGPNSVAAQADADSN